MKSLVAPNGARIFINNDKKEVEILSALKKAQKIHNEEKLRLEQKQKEKFLQMEAYYGVESKGEEL